MKRKIILLASLVLFLATNLVGQEPAERVWMQVDSLSGMDARAVPLPAVGPLRFGTTIGTSFVYAPHLGGAINWYAAPHLDYSVTSRFNVQGGILALHSAPFAAGTSEARMYNESISSFSLFASASYRLTNYLVIHGTGVKYLSGIPMPQGGREFDFNDISLGATLQLGNFSIGASFHRTDQSPYRMFPGLNGFSYGPPLYW